MFSRSMYTHTRTHSVALVDLYVRIYTKDKHSNFFLTRHIYFKDNIHPNIVSHLRCTFSFCVCGCDFVLFPV